MPSLLSNTLAVLIIISFRFSVIFGWCDRYSSDCDYDQVCCRNQCVYGSNCLYQSCSMDSDCSVNEACCSGQCRAGSDCNGQSCSKKSDCSAYEACCSGKCRPGSDCSGQFCSKKSDCSVGESCCNSVCKHSHDCSGYFCFSSNDCSVGQKCCVSTCTSYHCDDPTAAIAIAVVSSLVGLFLVFMLIYFCNRPARLGRPSTLEMERQVATTVASTTQSAIHSSPHADQQGYSYQSLS